MPLRFDTKHLEALDRLAPKDRTLFAAACAERLLFAHAAYSKLMGCGGTSVLQGTLARLWDDLSGKTMEAAELSSRMSEIEALLPDPDGVPDGWGTGPGVMEDATAALLYAFDCRKSGSADHAGAAANRAHEALLFILMDLGEDPNDLDAWERVRLNASVQTELRRQQRDMDELERGAVSVEALRIRANLESATFLPTGWEEKM
jgi:uncharacterized protein YjaG (DUF416 family)